MTVCQGCGVTSIKSFVPCFNCGAVNKYTLEEGQMQEFVIKLRGGYELKLQSDGESVKMEVFASDGRMVDLRQFSHRDLTGEQSEDDLKSSYNRRGW